MSKLLTIFVVAAALLTPNRALVYAGECVGRDEEYVAALESGPGSPSFDYAVECLCCNPVLMSRLWAGPNAAAKFAELRADTLRPRLVRAVSALLSSSWAASRGHRQLLYRIVARRGVAELDSMDVFTTLLNSGQEPYFGIYQDMAILADCRTVAFLRTRYLQLREGRKQGYFEEMLDLLSCLHHVPCDDAVDLAKDLYSLEQDQGLRDRLQRTLDRE